jgi:F5/8 type C domain/FecR protein
MRSVNSLSPVSRVMTFLMVASLAAILVSPSVHASPSRSTSHKKAGTLGKVVAIQNGLTVQPPHQRPAAGKTKQTLGVQYFLRTKPQQRAAVRFNDGTYLYINQRTDLLLASPLVTTVTSGEVSEVLQPGTIHKVQTASAIAAALGTRFDVREVRIRVGEQKRGPKKKGKLGKVVERTIIVVVEGALIVESPQHPGQKVTVRKNQQTIVEQGKKPTKPTAVDAQKVVTWAKSLPIPKAEKVNIALADNGGKAVAASSTSLTATALAGEAHQTVSPWDKKFAVDGTLDRGWASAKGRIKGEWLKLQFNGHAVYSVSGVAIDPAATSGLPANDATRHFEVWTSLSGTADADFNRVFTGELPQIAPNCDVTRSVTGCLARFIFPQVVPARYVKIVAVDNYGGDRDALAEVEVLSSPAKTANPPTPTSIPTPTATPTLAATATATTVPTATNTPTPLATATPVRPGFKIAVTYVVNVKEPGPPADPADDLDKTLTVVLTANVCGSNPFAQPWNFTEQYTLSDPSDNIFSQQTDSFKVSFTAGGSTALTGDTSQIANETVQYVDGPTTQVKFHVTVDPTVGTAPLDQTIAADVQTYTNC